METKAFLTENKQEVVNFFNASINNYYNVTIKDFMTDLLVNFRKVTTGVDLKRFDLVANLDEAKSRLGLMSKNHFEYAQDKKTNALRAKYAGTAKMSLI